MAREVPLSRGMFATVDDADYEPVMAAGPWHACPSGNTAYARRHVTLDGRRTTQNMQTFLTGWPQTDHRNTDGLDNRRANLREATTSQNMANGQRRKTSGFKGVFPRESGRWRAKICVENRPINLGTFTDPADAARAYDAAARLHFGEFARPNFPDGIES